MNWHSVAGEFAQCVMCYRTAAAQQAERSRVLNAGILVLLVPPLLVMGLILGLAWWRNRAGAAVATNNFSDSAVRERRVNRERIIT